MKKYLSVKAKITLWFSLVLVVITILTSCGILYISNSVIHKNIMDNLIETVEGNFDEIEYYNSIEDIIIDNDADQYIKYNSGYIEIDDDYLDKVNEVYSSCCLSDGTLIYGENPIAQQTIDLPFEDRKIQKLNVGSTMYYVYDRQLTRKGTQGLWIRGIVSSQQGTSQIMYVARILLITLPLFVGLSIAIGYFLARRALLPVKNISDTVTHIEHSNDLKKRVELRKGEDELHKLANSFNAMLERLDRSFESEKQFVSDVSHELRTPVSVIVSQCELTLEAERSTEEYENALRVIERQSDKMQRLIGDMLSFTRIEKNAHNTKMEIVDFSSLVQLVCRDMQFVNQNGIKLKSDIQSDICVTGNSELLSRLVSNLISNAYRYGRENGFINVKLITDGNNACLSVEDNGIGISESDIEKIFNRFYRADTSRSSEGTGLGLAIVKEISDLHGAEITVESCLNRGSRFTFVIKNETMTRSI